MVAWHCIFSTKHVQRHLIMGIILPLDVCYRRLLYNLASVLLAIIKDNEILCKAFIMYI